MSEGCKFTKWRHGKHDHGYQNKEPLYMAMLNPCGASVWLDDLCREHKLVMDYTTEARDGAIKPEPEAMTLHPWFNDMEKKKLGGRNAHRNSWLGKAVPDAR